MVVSARARLCHLGVGMAALFLDIAFIYPALSARPVRKEWPGQSVRRSASGMSPIGWIGVFG